MPEGDSIFRTARTLERVLAGHRVTRFESVFPHLTRIADDTPIRGRTVERVDARGKHLLIWFSGDLVLRTHMRMNGSWHVYRPGERWYRPRHEMRIIIETASIHAVAFTVPVAEFVPAGRVDQTEALRELGPDPLSSTFAAEEAIGRILSRGDMEIADALLDQSVVAGLGNIYKSEVLFVGRVHPFARVRDLAREDLQRLVTIAGKLMRANVGETATGGIVTYGGLRRTTGRRDAGARRWVYGRAGKPCRRCGTPISRQKQGPFARSTYWCERCQTRPAPPTEAPHAS